MSRTLHCVLPMGAVGALLLGAPAWSAPWSRGYVVDRFEPGFLFGGPTVRTADGLKRATGEPGTDCPNGISRASRRAKLTVPWRDPAVIDAYADAPPDGGGNPKVTPAGFFAMLAQRGYREGINTSFSVFAAPDPGIQEVGSDVADGFDLDGDPRTGGFRSPSGQPGVDNAWYRAVGCIISWRGAGARYPDVTVSRATFDREASALVASLAAKTATTARVLNLRPGSQARILLKGAEPRTVTVPGGGEGLRISIPAGRHDLVVGVQA